MPTGDAMADRMSNRLLSDARRAHRLAQQQLAEAVNAEHWRRFGKAAAIDAEHVSKFERGVITWPNSRYRAALREVLGADTDAELGFYYRRTAATVDIGNRATVMVSPVRRDEFIRFLTGLGAGAGLGVPGFGTVFPDPVREVLLLAAEPSKPPARIGRTDVDQVRYATETFEFWLGRYGSGAWRDALAAQLRWAARLLQGLVDPVIRTELYSAVGSLAGTAGWGDMDVGYHHTATNSFRLALHCAEKAQDWTLRAVVLTDISQHALTQEQLDDATSLIELAQLRSDRVAGTGRANMSSARALILGAAGRVADCRSAVSAAEDHFANHQPAGEPSGSSLFCQADADDLALYNSNALFRVALHGPATARAVTSRLRAALTQPGAVERRVRRAMSTAKLATLELLHGDRDEGVALGHQALNCGDDLRSALLTDHLRRLRTASQRHNGAPIVALRQQIDTALKSA